MDHYRRYQRLASREYLRQLVTQTKAYALKKHGRSITFSANTYDLAPSTLYYLDLLDYFSVETPYTTRYRYPPHRRVLPLLRLSQALGKPSVVLLHIESGADFNERGGVANLQRLHIAEAYASGNNTFLPDGVYAWSKKTGPDRYVGNLDVMAPVCRFIRGSGLYHDSRPWGAKVALVYLADSALSRPSRYWNSFTGTCWLLDDAHVPFDVVVAGDGNLVRRKLSLSDVQHYDMVLLSGGSRPTINEQTVLRRYMGNGGQVLWLGGDPKHRAVVDGAAVVPDVGATRFATESPKAADAVIKRVRAAADSSFEFRAPPRCAALPRILSDGTIAVHLVNFDYDVEADSFRRVPPSALCIKPDTPPAKMKAAMLGPPPAVGRPLQTRATGEWLEIDVPEFEVYSVVVIGEERRTAGYVAKAQRVACSPPPGPGRMKIDRDAGDWANVAATLPDGIKAVRDTDGVYFYVPCDEPRRFGHVVFAIDTDGDGEPDLSYYGDRWGGGVTRLGKDAAYLGRGRAAPCPSGVDLKISDQALAGARSLHVRTTRLNGRPLASDWVPVVDVEAVK